jgi:hypothetical protein
MSNERLKRQAISPWLAKQLAPEGAVYDYGGYAGAGFEKKPFTDGELEVIAMQMKGIEHLRDRVAGARTGGKIVNQWRVALRVEEQAVCAIADDHGYYEMTVLFNGKLRRLVIEDVCDAAGNGTGRRPVFR